jgi:hypothetical protein
MVLTCPLNIVENEQASSPSPRLQKTHRYSFHKDSIAEPSIENSLNLIESRFTSSKKPTSKKHNSISVVKKVGGDKKVRLSVNLQKKRKLGNVKTWFNRQRASQTPNMKLAMGTFEEEEQEEVGVMKRNLVEVRKVEKVEERDKKSFMAR